MPSLGVLSCMLCCLCQSNTQTSTPERLPSSKGNVCPLGGHCVGTMCSARKMNPNHGGKEKSREENCCTVGDIEACFPILWGGGGIKVRNLPRVTAILPQFFNDASIQKFQFSPEE